MAKKETIAAMVLEGNVLKKRGKPRGKPFTKNDPRTKPFPKGVSGNPTGKNAGRPPVTKISKAIGNWLKQEATEAYLREHGLSEYIPALHRAIARGHKITGAELVAHGLGKAAALGNHSAAKEMREVTEGRIPETLNLNQRIDYAAGQSAKEQLLDKLGLNNTPSKESEATEQRRQLQIAADRDPEEETSSAE